MRYKVTLKIRCLAAFALLLGFFAMACAVLMSHADQRPWWEDRAAQSSEDR